MTEEQVLGGQVAVVTGAAMGLGREIAANLSSAGAVVVATDQDIDALRASASEGAYGKNYMIVRADVSVPSDVESLFATVVKKYGNFQILINNAGITKASPFLETTLELWEQQLRVNATGTFLCSQWAARTMKDKGYGRIVNISSHSGLLGSSGRSGYAASKGAVNSFSRVAAVELAEHGITVNAVAPGPVRTPHSEATHSVERVRAWQKALPISRYGEAREIATVVTFLASPAASYITGQCIAVDGGFTITGLIPSRDRC